MPAALALILILVLSPMSIYLWLCYKIEQDDVAFTILKYIGSFTLALSLWLLFGYATFTPKHNVSSHEVGSIVDKSGTTYIFNSSEGLKSWNTVFQDAYDTTSSVSEYYDESGYSWGIKFDRTASTFSIYSKFVGTPEK